MIRKRIVWVLLAVMLCAAVLPLTAHASTPRVDYFTPEWNVEKIQAEFPDLQQYAVSLDRTDEFDFYIGCYGDYDRDMNKLDPTFGFHIMVMEKNTDNHIMSQRVDLVLPEHSIIEGVDVSASFNSHSWKDIASYDEYQPTTIWGLPAVDSYDYMKNEHGTYSGFINLGALFNLDAEDMEADAFRILVWYDEDIVAQSSAEAVVEMLINPSVTPTLSEPAVFYADPDYFGISTAEESIGNSSPGNNRRPGDRGELDGIDEDGDGFITTYEGNILDGGSIYIGLPGRDTGHASAGMTIFIGLIALILAILFGGAGGAVPPMPAPAGVPPASPYRGGSPWIRFDGDGDMVATDPVNGNQRTFVGNGDGTYTDPVSGATYTPQELAQQLESRAENAGLIRQDEAQGRRNAEAQRERNQQLSEDNKRFAEERRQRDKEFERKMAIDKIATELGMSGASEAEVREELERRKGRDEEYSQYLSEHIKDLDKAIAGLEATEKFADSAMALGEAAGPVHTMVSAGYKGLKNVAGTVAEKGLRAGTLVEGAIKGGTEAATTILGGAAKVGAAVGGGIAGEVAGAVNDNKSVTDAALQGAAKGLASGVIGVASDAAGNAIKGSGLTPGADVMDTIKAEGFIAKGWTKTTEYGVAKGVDAGINKAFKDKGEKK